MAKKTAKKLKLKNAINGPAKWYAAAGLAFVIIAAAGLVYRSSQPKAQTNSNSQAAVVDTCANSDTRVQNTYSCYKTELTAIVNRSGAEAATNLLKQQYSTVAYVTSNCHQLMHVIGRAAYAKYNNLADTFAHGSQYCNGGYYHGLSEQLGNERGLAYLKANANTLCAPIAAKKGRYSFYHYNCVHGMGHAFMEVTQGQLFDSLSGCDLIKDSWERSSCYGGVFMQNIMIEQSPDDSVDHTSKYLKADDPMYPCTVVQDKYKQQCYLMQTSHALQVEGGSFQAVFALCDSAEGSYKDTCYTSMGRDASGQSVYVAQKTQAICLQGTSSEAQTNCIIGAVKDYVDNFQSDKQASEICNGLPTDIGSTCNATLKSYYTHF